MPSKKKVHRRTQAEMNTHKDLYESQTQGMQYLLQGEQYLSEHLRNKCMKHWLSRNQKPQYEAEEHVSAIGMCTRNVPDD